VFKGIEHFAIAAKNTDLLAQWYCENLGFRIAHKNEKKPPTYFIRGEEGSMLEIIPANEKLKQLQDLADAGPRHVAISVNDFDKAYNHLRSRGTNFLGEPRDASGGVRVVFFMDAEQNIIHLIFRPNPI
jgi:catechol 2,3-dioxygenase-like lactoylglutathione lyase family enzyme